MTDGTVQLYGGKVLLDAGKVSLADACCCGEPAAPCNCPCDATEWAALVADGTPCHGLVAAYRIKDYTDGDLSVGGTCASCDAGGALSVWNGTFPAKGADSRCRWLATLLENDLQTNGKKLGALTNILNVPTPVCLWRVQVYCFQAPITSYLMWEGTKSIGLSPVGIYTRTAGCDATSTLEIEAVP